MSHIHDQHILDGTNMDINDQFPTREDYLRLTEDWEDPLPPPIVMRHQTYGDDAVHINVVRDDLIDIGTKARFGDLLIKTAKQDTICYVQPRAGFAGRSLAWLCRRYNKRLVLFCPASAEISQHQASCYHEGAELKFHKIAAMPVLNQIAHDWAVRNDAMFVPFGLKHPLVCACGVRVAYDMICRHGEPTRVWTAISTGVLSRALQIAWPNAEFFGVAVSRNIQEGESGKAGIYSSRFRFAARARILPPFPTVGEYDGKVWEFIQEHGRENDWFWNVGCDLPLQKIPKLDCQREWNEHRY